MYKLPKWLFFLLSFTWGLPLTLIGCIVTIVLLVAGYTPKRCGYSWYFEIGDSWGGQELGICYIKGKSSEERIDAHELGHGIQNCYLGIFMPIVCLLSALWYWFREIVYAINKEVYYKLPPYDIMPWEENATHIGKKFLRWLDDKER